MKRLLVLALLLLSASCSSGAHPSSGPKQPRASAFAAGSCRSLAEPVLSMGRELSALRAQRSPSQRLLDQLKRDQASVRALQPALEARLAPLVAKLVSDTGVVRLRADTNSFEPQLASDAYRAYQAVVSACTAA